jgi:SAM-dependent methyltransferase
VTSASSPNNPCPVCSDRLELHISGVLDPVTGREFDILRCGLCGMGVTDPAPAQLEPYYAEYHGRRHGPTARFCARRRMSLIARLAGEGGGRKLLDVGCGEGTFLMSAQEAGWQGVGTEIQPGPARRLGLNVFRSLEECTDLAPFHCVTLWHSLEHMRDPQAVISQARKLLAPDGFLFIAVPDFEGLQSKTFKARWLHLDVPRHLYHFTGPSLDEMLRRTEFAPVARWHQELEYDVMGWSQSALNAILSTPNIFFDLLNRKRVRASLPDKILSWVSGVAFSFAALPLVWLGSLARRGGTLLVAARTSGPKLRAT